MQLGKYKSKSFNRSFNINSRGLSRQQKFSFRLYYGIGLILSGLIVLIIGFFLKIL